MADQGSVLVQLSPLVAGEGADRVGEPGQGGGGEQGADRGSGGQAARQAQLMLSLWSVSGSFPSLTRVTVRNAAASMDMVTCRYQGVYLRTW